MKTESSKRILIAAGEVSGDLLGSHLCKALQKKLPTAEFFGMGGQQMRDAGVDILVDSDQLAVVGGLEVLTHFSAIRSAFKIIKQTIKNKKPDIIILIDYPGFNLRIAKFAKKAGVKVFYYVSPQIWAWRYHRIHHIKKYVDQMAVLFAFEKKIYEKENVPVRFVGHPITDIAHPTISREKAYKTFALKADQPIIALLPGSRKEEVSRLLPNMIKAIPLIRSTLPNAQFVLPLAMSLTPSDIESVITPDITVIKDNTYNVLSICDAAIAVSGTVTLEIALLQVPLFIIYKTSALTYWIAKKLIKIKNIGLCNIVAQTNVARELIQGQATATAIAEETIRLLQDRPYRQDILKKLTIVKENLGSGDASNRAADAALELLAIS